MREKASANKKEEKRSYRRVKQQIRESEYAPEELDELRRVAPDLLDRKRY